MIASRGNTKHGRTSWLKDWMPNWQPPPPPPPPSEANYTRFRGGNAYGGHGAIAPKPDVPATGKSLIQCEQICDADPKCVCVTFQREPGGTDWQKCFVRYECVPAKFEQGTAYDTYVKKASTVVAHGAAVTRGAPVARGANALAAVRMPEASTRLPPITPPPEISEWPVTFISLNEARAYCRWAGGRLPHAWEWQYAAQGTDGRPYPWGNETCEACWPKFNTGNIFPGPEPVGAHAPAGDSPFGVSGMAGNVWHYTDEVNDEHTRSVLLRGGSNYRPDGSNWYFPNRAGPGAGVPCGTHNKYMLFGEVYERAGTIGFRCVYDAE